MVTDRDRALGVKVLRATILALCAVLLGLGGRLAIITSGLLIPIAARFVAVGIGENGPPLLLLLFAVVTEKKASQGSKSEGADIMR